MEIVVIAILILVAAAGLLIVSTLRRRESVAAGHLSRETRKRDRSSCRATALEEGSTGRDVDLQTLEFEADREKLNDVRLIIDDENPGFGHVLAYRCCCCHEIHSLSINPTPPA